MAQPKLGAIARTITLPGNVRALQEATLYAKVAGYLKSIPVDLGDHVEKGAPLGEIETPEMLADLVKAEASLAVAEMDFNRVSKAAEKAPDLVMPQTVDAARGRHEIARAELTRLKTLLRYANLEAPFGGIITRRWVDPGAFIPSATSSSAAQSAAILTLMDFSRVRIEVAVPEPDVSAVQRGQAATVTSRALSGRTFTGTVTRFAYALDPSTKTMTAEIELPNSDLALRPGMFVEVELEFASPGQALLLPGEAILGEKGKTHVFVARDGKAIRVPVKTGMDSGIQIEVIEGLTAEDNVILTGRQSLIEGQAVEITVAK